MLLMQGLKENSDETRGHSQLHGMASDVKAAMADATDPEFRQAFLLQSYIWTGPSPDAAASNV